MNQNILRAHVMRTLIFTFLAVSAIAGTPKTVAVQGSLTDQSGQPYQVAGSDPIVIIIKNIPGVADTGNNASVHPYSRTVTCTDTSNISVTLVPNTGTGITPTGSYYEVETKVPGITSFKQKWSVPCDDNGSGGCNGQDLADVIVPAATTAVLVQGQRSGTALGNFNQLNIVGTTAVVGLSGNTLTVTPSTATDITDSTGLAADTQTITIRGSYNGTAQRTRDLHLIAGTGATINSETASNTTLVTISATGAVATVTGGSGLTDSGTASDPILDVNVLAPLAITSDSVSLDIETNSGLVVENNRLYLDSARVTHNGLGGLDSGDYQHLSSANKTDLTDGNTTDLHGHTSASPLSGTGTSGSPFDIGLSSPLSDNSGNVSLGYDGNQLNVSGGVLDILPGGVGNSELNPSALSLGSDFSGNGVTSSLALTTGTITGTDTSSSNGSAAGAAKPDHVHAIQNRSVHSDDQVVGTWHTIKEGSNVEFGFSGGTLTVNGQAGGGAGTVTTASPVTGDGSPGTPVDLLINNPFADSTGLSLTYDGNNFTLNGSGQLDILAGGINNNELNPSALSITTPLTGNGVTTPLDLSIGTGLEESGGSIRAALVTDSPLSGTGGATALDVTLKAPLTDSSGISLTYDGNFFTLDGSNQLTLNDRNITNAKLHESALSITTPLSGNGISTPLDVAIGAGLEESGGAIRAALSIASPLTGTGGASALDIGLAAPIVDASGNVSLAYNGNSLTLDGSNNLIVKDRSITQDMLRDDSLSVAAPITGNGVTAAFDISIGSGLEESGGSIRAALNVASPLSGTGGASALDIGLSAPLVDNSGNVSLSYDGNSLTLDGSSNLDIRFGDGESDKALESNSNRLLTATQVTDLTDAGTTDLHGHTSASPLSGTGTSGSPFDIGLNQPLTDGSGNVSLNYDGTVFTLDGSNQLDLLDGGVTNSHIALNAIRTEHVLDETLTVNDLADLPANTLIGNDLDVTQDASTVIVVSPLDLASGQLRTNLNVPLVDSSGISLTYDGNTLTLDGSNRLDLRFGDGESDKALESNSNRLLTATQVTDLTDAGTTDLHGHTSASPLSGTGTSGSPFDIGLNQPLSDSSGNVSLSYNGQQLTVNGSNQLAVLPGGINNAELNPSALSITTPLSGNGVTTPLDVALGAGLEEDSGQIRANLVVASPLSGTGGLTALDIGLATPLVDNSGNVSLTYDGNTLTLDGSNNLDLRFGDGESDKALESNSNRLLTAAQVTDLTDGNSSSAHVHAQGGDLAGTTDNATVTKIQSTPVVYHGGPNDDGDIEPLPWSRGKVYAYSERLGSGQLEPTFPITFTNNGTPAGAGFELNITNPSSLSVTDGVATLTLPGGTHASTHLPGGSDALTTANATSTDSGVSNAEGVAASFARSDHKHDLNIEARHSDNQTLGFVDILKEGTSIDFGNSSGVLSVNLGSHASSHLPGGGDALTTASVTGTAAASIEGVATSFARSDHEHLTRMRLQESGGAAAGDAIAIREGTNITFIEAASGTFSINSPNVPSSGTVTGTTTANSNGTGTAYALADHEHLTSVVGRTGAGGNLGQFHTLQHPGGAVSTGVMTLPGSGNVTGTDITESDGTPNSTYASADHVHLTNVVGRTGTGGNLGLFHTLEAPAASFSSGVLTLPGSGTVTGTNSANSNGTGTSYSLANHEHITNVIGRTGTGGNLGLFHTLEAPAASFSSGVLTLPGSGTVTGTTTANSNGTGTAYALANHEHLTSTVGRTGTGGNLGQFHTLEAPGATLSAGVMALPGSGSVTGTWSANSNGTGTAYALANHEHVLNNILQFGGTNQGLFHTLNLAGSGAPSIGVAAGVATLTFASSSSAVVEAKVYTSSTAFSTSSEIPTDDSIPQNTEGASVLSGAITIDNTTNDVIVFAYATMTDAATGSTCVMAVCETGTANALAAVAKQRDALTVPLIVIATQSNPGSGSKTYDIRAARDAGGGSVFVNQTDAGTGNFSTCDMTTLLILEVTSL